MGKDDSLKLLKIVIWAKNGFRSWNDSELPYFNSYAIKSRLL